MKSLSAYIELLKSKTLSSPERHSGNSSVRALDMGRTRLMFLEGNVAGEKIRIDQFAFVPLSFDVPVQQALKILFEEKKCSRESLRISLKSPQVVTRFLRFPKMNEKELRGVLQYEIEQYVPYESKDIYLDLAVLQESIKTDQGENTEIFVAVAKKESLDNVLKQFQDLESDVEAVDVDILACMKCLEFFHPADFSGHAAILDLGINVTTLGVVRNSRPRFVRDLSFGSLDISKKLKNRANVSESSIQDFLDGKTVVTGAESPLFLDSIENLVNDVKVSFDYYRDQSEDGAGVDKLFVSGLGSGQEFILNALQKSLDVPVQKMDLMSKIELGPDVSSESIAAMIADLPVSLGLLLRTHD